MSSQYLYNISTVKSHMGYVKNSFFFATEISERLSKTKQSETKNNKMK